MKRVIIIADWDADGCVSAALALYLLKTGQPPLSCWGGKEVEVRARPAGPRQAGSILSEVAKECPDGLLLLDIPLTDNVAAGLRRFSETCRGSEIIYVDHHPLTIERRALLEELAVKFAVQGEAPTAQLLAEEASRRGAQVHEKLAKHVEAVKIMELGLRPPDERAGLVKFVASISRVLKLERDEELWLRLVNWMTNPLPMPLGRAELEALKRIEKEIGERDRELEEAAVNLALSAEKLACLRFVDARKRWRRRGATSLANRLSRILGAPVALLTKIGESEILVIKTRDGSAKLLGEKMIRERLATDLGGHRNVAVARLAAGVDLQKLKRELSRACVEIALERGKRSQS
ncbi:MAG: hypothetical protein QXU97_01010 [Fervidicoccaceae archaeon]